MWNLLVVLEERIFHARLPVVVVKRLLPVVGEAGGSPLLLGLVDVPSTVLPLPSWVAVSLLRVVVLVC